MRFARRVEALLHLAVQWGKMSCWSSRYDLRACPHRLQHQVPVGRLDAAEVDRVLRPEVERLPAEQRFGLLAEDSEYAEYVGYGIMVGGVPLGDGRFEALATWQVASRSVSAIRYTSSALRRTPGR